MYPPVRQFESSDLHFQRVMRRLERAAGPQRPRRRRARWIAAAVAAAVVAGAVYAAAANAAAAHAACTAGPATVAGSPARTFCGPATAAVTFGGRTFRFGNGACTAGTGFTVNIGTVVLESTAKARPYFGFFLTSAQAGTYSGKEASVSFASGAVRVSLAPSSSSRVVLDRGRRSGSFSGRDLLGRRLVGSFHC